MAASGLFASAQQDRQSPASLSQFTMHGTVIDAITKQPIARALVQSGKGDVVLTDSNGNFEFPDIQPGEQTITVRRPGYVSNQDQPGFQPSQSQISSFQVAARAGMQSLILPLTPEAIITGRLATPDSDPEDGIQIMAYRRTIENGRPKWQMAGIGITTSEGIFRVASLPAGTYLLYTQPPNYSYAAPDNAPSSGYPAVYYPGVTDASAAGTVTLSPGEHKQADITLLRQTFYPVAIRVANVQPGDSFNLEIMDSGGRPLQAPVRLDSLQSIGHTRLTPGHYFLTARVFDARNIRAPLFSQTEFTVTAAPAYITVTAVPLRAIPVTIHKEFAAPLPQAIIYSGTRHLRISLNVSLINAGAEFPGGAGDYGGQLEPVPGSNDDGDYQISSVAPGRYWVEAYPFEGYVSSITSGGVDLTRDLFTVGASGSSAPIEITLRNDTGSLDGTIINTQSQSDSEVHQTASQTWIYAVPLFNTVSPLATAQTDASGKFAFSSLAPGSYRVIASGSPLQIEYHSPDALAALSNKGQAVGVEPGSTAHLQLDITPSQEPLQEPTQ